MRQSIPTEKLNESTAHGAVRVKGGHVSSIRKESLPQAQVGDPVRLKGNGPTLLEYPPLWKLKDRRMRNHFTLPAPPLPNTTKPLPFSPSPIFNLQFSILRLQPLFFGLCSLFFRLWSFLIHPCLTLSPCLFTPPPVHCPNPCLDASKNQTRRLAERLSHHPP